MFPTTLSFFDGTVSFLPAHLCPFFADAAIITVSLSSRKHSTHASTLHFTPRRSRRIIPLLVKYSAFSARGRSFFHSLTRLLVRFRLSILAITLSSECLRQFSRHVGGTLRFICLCCIIEGRFVLKHKVGRWYRGLF